MAKKLDRFGWDRDKGSAAHDRLMIDWMDALQDYPLDEVRAACKAAVMDNPNKLPNEGHIVAQIKSARARFVAAHKPSDAPEPPRDRMSADRAAEIMREVGFAVRKFE